MRVIVYINYLLCLVFFSSFVNLENTVFFYNAVSFKDNNNAKVTPFLRRILS